MNKSLSALALLLLLAIPGRAADPAAAPGGSASAPADVAAPAAADWKEYTYKADLMAFSMPGEPQIATQDLPDGDKKVPITIYSLKVGNYVLLLTANDCPADEIAKDTADHVCKSARDGALSSMNAKVVSEKDITIDNNHGIEFEYASDAVHGVMRVYLVGTHLYQVAFVTAIANPLPPEGTRFLNSFKLVKP